MGRDWRGTRACRYNYDSCSSGHATGEPHAYPLPFSVDLHHPFALTMAANPAHQRMWIGVGFVVKLPAIPLSANIKLAIGPIMCAVPLALISRPVSHTGRASLGPVLQLANSNSRAPVKWHSLIVVIAILLDCRIRACDIQLARVIVSVPPGVDRLQRLMWPGACRYRILIRK